MAQNITLMGASYSDVPSVELPKTGGGTASFTDTSPTTAAAADVASGKYFFTANGVLTLGTSSGGIEDGHVYQDADGYIVLDDETGKVYQSKSVSYTPSETAQSATVTADNGYDALSSVSVSVGAVSSSYVGSGITRRSSSDLTASGATVTAPAGYYASSASTSVASGSVTASATKGTVSNHSVSVTPSASVTAGYISSGATGTAVTVSASELVSGNKAITSNGTDIDVANYSTVSVAVSGGNSDLKAIIDGTAVTPTLPSDLTSIRGYAFYGLTTLAITSLPSGIEGIGTYAFYNCSNLALTALPDTYYSLGTYAFYGCTNMPLASLGSLFSSGIPSNAFNGCKAITALDCANASSIAANGFANCNALRTLVLRRTVVVTLANVSAFLNTPLRGYNSQTATVYVPSDLVDSYKTASNWKTIYDAGSLTFSSIEGSAYEL